jgi:uncharacterized protein YigE (DUF2233 family)
VVRRASFPLSDVSIAIEDVHMSTRLDLALADPSVELAINGGFFGTDTEPIGLASSAGSDLGKFAPGMSGGVLSVSGGRARLTATEEYKNEPVSFAIQCRPRLVVQSRVNIRSDDGRRAPRTAICIKERGLEMDVVVAGLEGRPEPTLRELAEELAQDGCEEALNLDGGPSSGWASRADGGITFDSPRAPVRHAVVVRHR